jgi:hypothetical protein
MLYREWRRRRSPTLRRAHTMRHQFAQSAHYGNRNDAIVASTMPEIGRMEASLMKG